MEELTLEQALRNIENVLNDFRGTKLDHVLLERSMLKIKENIIKVEDLTKK